MFKSVLTICLGVTVLLWGASQVWAADMEDRFINPDIDTSKSVFIDVKNASLLNVLKIFSKQTNLSFIAQPDVADKQITLYLNKVPLNQALQMVLDANGLTYEMQQDSSVFVIKAKYATEKPKITRVYPLKYATVSSSKLNGSMDAGSGGGGGAKKGSSGASVSSGGLEEVLKDALSPDGKVVEDARTNSLIITDVPAQFDAIESTIARLDVPIPQILIEVEMIDVSKSTGDHLGITYGANPLTFTGGAKAVNYPFSTSPATASSSGSTGSTGSTGSSSSGSSTAGPYSPGSFSATGMTATLNFIATASDARTLARPRILTLNNETAQIEISTDQALSVEQTSSSTTGTGSTVTGNTVERYTTGVILKVTPQADLLTREITMAVSPKVVDVILSQVGSSIYDPETRGSDSILKLKDGQSMVIGGLMRTQDNKSVTKLPFLGDLPLVGSAFRSTTNSKNERELLIFLTPHIIDDSDQAALKGNAPMASVETALDLQDTDNRTQEINSSLNNFDSK